ncbi:hypothetical protein F5Y04DRAFT_257065 [Hypomontagnella monticulosa]|nr:hypothetical protein F5Y04DRAFT_257065 [Hypomontagnella monticulosa]
MNSLVELAKMQVQAFELAVRSQSDTQTVPIDKILEKDNIIQCNVSNNPADIANMIQDTFSSFITGDILDGVSKLVGNGLKLLFGSYSGNSSSRDTYAITCGVLGGISRIDMHFYSYRYTSSQLTDTVKQVLCVSIIRSSVDPTKLSDATLRNIVQNTYSTSPSEAQNKMYAQLAAARDADLRSRMGTEVPISGSLSIAAARANQFPRLTARFGKSKTTQNLTSSAQEVVYTTYSKTYTARLQINTAEENVEALKNWIYGYLYSDFEKLTIDNGIVVTGQVSSGSTSNSEIEGHVTLVLSSEIQGPEQAFHQQLNDALKGTVSNKCPIPVTAYTIDGAFPEDGDHGNQGESPPNPVPGGGDGSGSGEQIWHEDDFSDDEGMFGRNGQRTDAANGTVTVQGLPDVEGNSYPYTNLSAARYLAKGSLIMDEPLDIDTPTVMKKQIYLRPNLVEFRHIITDFDLVESFFAHEGTHVHITLNETEEDMMRYKISNVVVTLRHPSDINTIKDYFNYNLGSQNWHFKCRRSAEVTVDGFVLATTASYWVQQGANAQTPFGQEWIPLQNHLEADRASMAFLAALKELGRRADRVLEKLTSGDWEKFLY